MESVVTLEKAQVIYSAKKEQLTATAPLSLEIKKGEFICLVGPSGCGKSTLLKLMAGYLQPTVGEVRMHEQIIEGPDWRRGVVFQTSTLFPWLSVQKNIEYGMKVRKVPAKERKKEARRFLEQIEMLDFADHYPHELSGGMKQRVAMARTMVNQPELLLMDEPFGALDALTRMKMQALMRKIWQESQQTVFLITHDIEEALSLATRVIVMSKSPGSLLESIEVDYSRKALATPQNEVVMDATFLALKDRILHQIYTG